jgi:hypothetical protein
LSVRRTWRAIHWLGAALLLSAGCKHAEKSLKPPARPEEMVKAPEDDPRFSKPVTYPDSTLNQYGKKKKQTPDGPAGNPSRFTTGSAPMGSGAGY